MSDRISRLVRDANPAPDPDTSLDSGDRTALFAEIEQRTGLAKGPTVERIRKPKRSPRWAPALAAAGAIVAAITFALVVLTNDNPDATNPTTTLPAPGESSSPTEIVNALYTRWNERDIEGALAYLHPDARQARGRDVGSVAWWRNYLNYSVAAYGGDWAWILRDCTEVREQSVQCRLGVANEPLLDARAAPSVLKQFDIQDGLIIRLPLPADATAADIAVDRYAKTQDPEGHLAACGIDGRDLLGEFVVYDQACGQFIAPYRLALAAELLGPPPTPSP